jgi:hypothetical protein
MNPDPANLLRAASVPDANPEFCLRISGALMYRMRNRILSTAWGISGGAV